MNSLFSLHYFCICDWLDDSRRLGFGHWGSDNHLHGLNFFSYGLSLLNKISYWRDISTVQHWPESHCIMTLTPVTCYQALTYPHTSLSFSWALTCAMWFSVCWNDCINSWFCTNKLCKRLGPSSPERVKKVYHQSTNDKIMFLMPILFLLFNKIWYPLDLTLR